jgi:hypothetical protein
MFALAMCGCKQSPNIGDEVELDIVETEYDEHQYIIFSGHGVLHNPKCKCHE